MKAKTPNRLILTIATLMWLTLMDGEWFMHGRPLLALLALVGFAALSLGSGHTIASAYHAGRIDRMREDVRAERPRPIYPTTNNPESWTP